LLGLYDRPHLGWVAIDVHLGTTRLHREALSGVEPAKLNCTAVGYPAHGSAQGIDLPHKTAFGQTTHRWVARQTPNVIEVHGDHSDRGAQPRRSQCSLTARMTTSNYYYIK
jgi:hypothetical protein